MVAEVVEWLDPRPGHLVVDGTVGAGGHSRAVLPRIMPGGFLIGVDIDPEMLELARESLVATEFWPDNIRLFVASYIRIPELIAECGGSGADGIIIDAGLSADQILSPGRGFSFSVSDKLDARFNREESHYTAADVVNKKTWQELVDIFQRYGDEPHAKRIARAIVNYRQKKPIETTDELADIVVKATGRRHGRIHGATKVFQALRIEVNRELATLEEGVRNAIRSLNPSGRFVILSYHSGEDRIAKHVFREAANGMLPESEEKEFRVLTKKPLRPSEEEVRHNPKARSCRMRVLERVM